MCHASHPEAKYDKIVIRRSVRDLHHRAQQGALLNIVVGIIGAMIGGFLLGGPTINSNTFNLTALLVSFLGAVVLLAIVNLVRRGSVR